MVEGIRKRIGEIRKGQKVSARIAAAKTMMFESCLTSLRYVILAGAEESNSLRKAVRELRDGQNDHPKFLASCPSNPASPSRLVM